jgi:hypothetical protein
MITVQSVVDRVGPTLLHTRLAGEGGHVADVVIAEPGRHDAVETGDTGGLVRAPATVLTDLRTVAGWLLRQAEPNDFLSFGPRVGAAWRAAQAPYATGVRPSQFPPIDAGLMGATTVRALSLVDGDENAAIAQLRTLLQRSRHRPTVCPPGLTQQWNRITPGLRGRFLRAGDSDRGYVDRLRYRSCIATARVPDPGNDLATARERLIPQLLWPGWTIRLLPPHGFHTGPFRMVMSACLLLPGEHGRRRRGTPTRLHPHLRQPLYTVLHLLATRGHDAVLPALCHLADDLDEHGSPIDYHRRRTIVTPAILTEPDWLTLCRHASAHPGLRGGRFRQAQRYLVQLLTGADLADPQHSLAFRSAADRTGYYAFTTALTSALRTGLHDHTTNYLYQLGIDEPLSWEPPADYCPNLARLPGRDPDDIDLDMVQRLVIHDQQPTRVAADRLDTTVDHVRLALEHIPRTPTDWAATTSPAAAWQRRQHARRVLTPAVLHREYVTHGNDCDKSPLRQAFPATSSPNSLARTAST